MEVNDMTVASQLKQTLTNLKGFRGTLRVYSTQTRDEETRSVFTDALEDTNTIIKDLENRLQTLEFEEPQYKGI
jgi:bacterioferritin (cytochrome b1)